MAFHWLKVHAELPHHRKSLELAHELGEPLAWAYVVQLWGWCLKHAGDGQIVSKRPAMVVEHACGWRGEAGQLFEAMVSVGFLELSDLGVSVHDWADEQKPILAKAQRDAEKKRERRSNGAQTARAEIAPSAETAPKRRDNGAETAPAACLSVVSSLSSSFELGVQGEEKPAPRREPENKRRAEDLQNLWNEGRPDSLPAWKGMSKQRRAKAVLRLGEHTFDEWREVVARIRASDFCCGGGGQGWKAHPDWLLEPGSADKVLEGLYEARASGPGKPKDVRKGYSDAQDQDWSGDGGWGALNAPEVVKP